MFNVLKDRIIMINPDHKIIDKKKILKELKDLGPIFQIIHCLPICPN